MPGQLCLRPTIARYCVHKIYWAWHSVHAIVRLGENTDLPNKAHPHIVKCEVKPKQGVGFVFEKVLQQKSESQLHTGSNY